MCRVLYEPGEARNFDHHFGLKISVRFVDDFSINEANIVRSWGELTMKFDVRGTRSRAVAGQIGLLIGLFVALAGCDKGATLASGPDGLVGVRSAITAHNYAEALDLAHIEVARRPKDPAAQFELARIEALRGNEGRALDALDSAISGGLPDASRALSDPAFSSISGSSRFAEIAERGNPLATHGASAQSAGADRDRVEINESANGTHIRAGDVKLNTDF